MGFKAQTLETTKEGGEGDSEEIFGRHIEHKGKTCGYLANICMICGLIQNLRSKS